MQDFTLWQICLVELALAAIAVGAAYFNPWQSGVRKVEHSLVRLASRPVLAFFVLIFASIVLRLALLPLQTVPSPLFHDEFSYLLGADTFVHGRLTNPVPPVPIAFETMHINVAPTYQSMYMPGTAMVLAIGKMVGLPWLSVMMITGLLSGTVYWMTSAWLSRSYALLAGIATIVITGNMNWWFDNYFCIALTSLGTAVVLGSLPRIAGTKSARWALLAGVGLSALILTRPYEGFCVTCPCALALLWKIRHAGIRKLGPLVAAVCSVPAATIAWLLYYNWRGTGRALLFPYMLNLARYHITGPFLFSAKRALPAYDLDILRRFYIFAEVSQYAYIHEHPWLFLAKKIAEYHMAVMFGFGAPLVAGLVFLVLRRRDDLWLVPLMGIFGLVFNVVLMAWSPFPQYIAPAFPLLMLTVALGFSQVRKLNLGRITGSKIVRGFALAEIMFALSLFGYRVSDARNLPEPQYVSKDRNAVTAEVLRQPGKHLCLVRYTPFHESWQEWVFNGADLQGERIVWARSLDPQTDQAVISAFPGRTVWLVKPDFANELISAYDPNAPFPLTNRPEVKR